MRRSRLHSLYEIILGVSNMNIEEITEEEYDKYLKKLIDSGDDMISLRAYSDMDEKNSLKQNINLKYYRNGSRVYWVTTDGMC